MVNPRAVLALCCGATSMAFLDLSVVNLAFPSVVADFPDTPIATVAS